MNKKRIDLSEIKEMDLDKTASFTDIMSRKEKKNKVKEEYNNIDEKKNKIKEDNNDIEEMINERKKSTADLTKELEQAKEEYNNKTKQKDEVKSKEDIKEENLGKTQILELTRQMKFNFEETKKENNSKKKKGVSVLNIIGEINLLCIGYYIYLLVFTNYQEEQQNYLITGSIIVLLVLLFGFSVVTGKKLSKVFNILNILAIIGFILFNAYTLIN